eukprot:365408-Chlamydomonas_euryale.AAC.18
MHASAAGIAWYRSQHCAGHMHASWGCTACSPRQSEQQSMRLVERGSWKSWVCSTRFVRPKPWTIAVQLGGKREGSRAGSPPMQHSQRTWGECQERADPPCTPPAPAGTHP